MWVLLLTVITGSLFTVQPIEKYSSLQQCEQERIRITKDMQASYPIEEHSTFSFECVQVRKLHI